MLVKVCTEGAVSAPDNQAGLLIVLLRRTGVVVGVMFGLGLIALFVADRAAAQERSGDPARDGDLERTVVSVTTPLTTPLSDVVKPVSEHLVEPVVPVIATGAKAVEPVAEPVVTAVKPVTEPVTRPVVAAAKPVLDPVLDAVAPVTAPVLAPVLDAASPVVAPVTEATGADLVTEVVAGDGTPSAGAKPAGSPEVVPPAASAVEPVAAPEAAGVPVPERVSMVSASWEPVVARAGVPARWTPAVPGSSVPEAPVPNAVTGGGFVGSGGSTHSTDSAVSDVVAAHPRQDVHGLSPPGTIVGVAWFAYDDRDHPS